MANATLPPKKPVEVLDYKFDWSTRLLNGDRIVASSFRQSNTSTTSMDANTYANTTATVWLSGGTANTTTIVYNIVTTEGGRTMELGAKIKIIPE